jgi:ElaB/YqjD/DUF883 family membrane-anchored ribosome-binding protein
MAEERSDINERDNIDTSDRKESGYSMSETGDDQGVDGRADEIREQIEETRSEMGETIDAIQDRLSFANISDQVSEHVQNAVETGTEAIYDATIGRAAIFMKNAADNISNSNVMKTVKDNPVPLMLIGAGVGLLAFRTYSKPSYKDPWRYSNQGSKGSMRDPDSGQFEAMTEKASQTAHDAMNKVTDTFQQGYTQAGDIVNQAYGKAGEYKHAAVDQYRMYLNDNPLALGAAALGLGAVIGLAIPASTYEGELMGETRDNLLNRAQDAAAGLLDKTKQAIVDADLPVIAHKGSTAEH